MTVQHLKDTLTPTAHRTHIDAFDLLKTLAIWCVVAYHTNMFPLSIPTGSVLSPYLLYVLQTAMSVCIPVFLVVHGALFFSKPHLSLSLHYKKTTKLVGLTVFWGIFTLMLLSLHRHEHISMYSLIAGLYHLKQGFIQHLWFLETLVAFYLLAPLFHLAYHTRRPAFLAITLIVSIIAFGNSLFQMARSVYTAVSASTITLTQINIFSGFNPFAGVKIWAFTYLLLGGLFWAYCDYLRTRISKTAATTLCLISMLLLSVYGIFLSQKTGTLWDSIWYGYDSIFTACATLMLLYLTDSYRHSGRIGACITFISSQSLGIYLIHMIIIEYLRPVFLPHLSSLFISIPYTFVVFSLSLLLSLTLSKIPHIRILTKT